MHRLINEQNTEEALREEGRNVIRRAPYSSCLAAAHNSKSNFTLVLEEVPL